MSTAKTTRRELIAAVVDGGRALGTATLLFHQTIADRLGLHMTDHKCLGIAQEAGPITAGELAARTGLTTGAITGVIDRLEKKGFVRRDADPDDRRRVVVRVVAERVEQDIRPLFQSLARSVTRLAERYEDRELRLVIDYMQRARDLLEDEAAKVRSPALPDKTAATTRAHKPA